MGLELELELSELAVLGPIRTAVSSASDAATRPGNDGQDDADAGCVTPTAMSPMPWRGGVVDTGCVTPTSAASVLRPATVCPPAPRKPARASAKRKGCYGRTPQRRCFFPVPHDLATVFVPRGAAASSPSRPAAKKIRVHVVG